MTESSKSASAPSRTSNDHNQPTMGFWKCWAMAVGVMVGSGIFLLPAVLAPYGSISLLGWLVTSIGAVCLALVLGRLANHTDGSGGPYAYARNAFGDLAGFLIAWGYWISVTLAVTAVSIAFAGYLGTLVPALGASNLSQSLVALLAIWLLTAINVRGIAEASSVQLILTLLKLIPLIVIIMLGFVAGSTETLPAFNPGQLPVGEAIAATALLTMWAFAGAEAAVIPAADVIDAKRTIPRAVFWGSLTVAGLYILVAVAVMLLVPADVLATSEAPFVEAAKALGPWGAAFIGFGALLATAGSLNGNILVSGQMPMAVALDGLAPRRLARRNKGNAPAFALIFTAVLSSLLLGLNMSENLIGAFTFLISTSTLCVLLPYAVSALAELKYSWKSARGWGLIACLTVVYMIIAASGSGLKVLLWGAVLIGAGVPLFYFFKHKAPR
ncbi:MAG: amino acid permease [Pseudomonadota bacterium]